MKSFIILLTLLTSLSVLAANEIVDSSNFQTKKNGELTRITINKPLVNGHKIWSESDRDGICKAVLNEPKLKNELRGLTFIGSKEYDRTEYWITFTHAISLKNFVEIDQNGLIVGEIPSSYQYVKRMNCYLKEL